MTAQSVNMQTLLSFSMKKKLDTVLLPAAVPIMRRPARMTSAVEDKFPATPISASPRRTMRAPAARGFLTALTASSSEMSLPLAFGSPCTPRRCAEAGPGCTG